LSYVLKVFCTMFNAQDLRINYNSYTSKSNAIYIYIFFFKEKKRQSWWNSIYHKNWWFFEFCLLLKVDVIFCKFFFNLTPCITIFKVLLLCFPYFMYYCIVCDFFNFKEKNQYFSVILVLIFLFEKINIFFGENCQMIINCFQI